MNTSKKLQGAVKPTRNLVKLLVMAAVILSTALPGVASAHPDLDFSATLSGLQLVDTGTVTPLFDEGEVEVTTEGEVNQSTINCVNAACYALGFDGASITTVHDSEITINLETGELNGELEGTFDIELLSGVTINGGDIEADINGWASPVGGTFAFQVVDEGVWEVETIKAEGTFSLTVEGVLGLGHWGGGTFEGKLEAR